MEFEDYNFNLPGRIVEYFPEDQTATVRICAERNYDSSSELGASKERGLLQGVPVHTPSGGGWSMTMPIKVGDTCILFFSQVGYDHWLFEDKDTAGLFQGNPMFWTDRKFSLQDGYALVGLNTMQRVVKNYSPVHSQWRDEEATQLISLNSDGSIDVNSLSKVTVTAPKVDVVASSKVTITSPRTEIRGVLDVYGDTHIYANHIVSGLHTAAIDCIGGGISLKKHTHTSKVPGTPTSPPL